MSDPNAPGEWLSLTEAARRLDTTPDALRQRVRRGRMHASRGNDSWLRVWVPAGVETERSNRTPAEHPGRLTSDRPNEMSGQFKALQALVDVLREQLRTAEQREAAERTRAEAAEERERAAQVDRIVALETARAQAADLAARFDDAYKAVEALRRRPRWWRWWGW